MSRSTPSVSLGIRIVQLFFKVLVLSACALLPNDKARNLYRDAREWLIEYMRDSRRRVTTRGLAFSSVKWLVQYPLDQVVVYGDFEATIYHLIDKPMRGLVFWALPAGGLSGALVLGLTGDPDRALIMFASLGSLTWLMYVGYRLREMLMEDEYEVTPNLPESVNRILTVPNLLSVGRLVFGPLLVVWLAATDHFAGVGIVLGGCLVTDWMDGYLARRFNQVTKLGRLIDPIADVLVALALVSTMLLLGIGPVFILVLVLLRDAILSAINGGLAILHRPTPTVTIAGKLGFALLIGGLALYLLPEAGLGWLPRQGTPGEWAHVTALVLASVGLWCRLVAGVQYLRQIPHKP